MTFNPTTASRHEHKVTWAGRGLDARVLVRISSRGRRRLYERVRTQHAEGFGVQPEALSLIFTGYPQLQPEAENPALGERFQYVSKEGKLTKRLADGTLWEIYTTALENPVPLWSNFIPLGANRCS